MLSSIRSRLLPTHHPAEAPCRQPWRVSGRSIAYGRLYGWYILLATLDLVTTMVILSLGGREANPVANSVLQAAGPGGLLVLKYASVMLVVTICEFVHQHRPPLARLVVLIAVALSAFPVIVGLVQLAAHNAYTAAWG